MKNRIIKLLFFALAGLLSHNVEAKKGFPCQDHFKPIGNGLQYDSINHIYMADTTGIWNLIRQYSDKDLVVIVSSSQGCSYTPGAIEYLNSLIPENLNVAYLFVLGDNLKVCDEFPAFFKQLDEKIIRVVPSETYKTGGFLRGDARKRSDDLMKDVFPVAKDDIILTPKFYIYKPKTGELLFHGGRAYKNPYPADVVRYFLGKLKS